MFSLRFPKPAILLSLCLCSHASAAPQDTFRVTFAPWRIGVPADTGAHDSGLRLGDHLWLGAHRLKDREIAHVLYVEARLGLAPQIWLDYGADPADVNFAEVISGIEWLNRLIEGNLWKDHAIEIVVFPFHDSATLTTLRYDDGPAVSKIVDRGDKLSGLTWRVGQIITGPRSDSSVEPPCATRVTLARARITTCRRTRACFGARPFCQMNCGILGAAYTA